MLEGFSSELLISLIQQYGVFAVFLAAVIEEVIVPIPSPVVPMAAGAIIVTASDPIGAALQVFVLITLPASVGSVLSSYFVYSVAFFGGKEAIDRYGKYLELKWSQLKGLEERFAEGREGYYVFAFRAVPVVPLSLVSGAAGLFRMDWRSYGAWSFVGMLPRTFSLGMVGWYLSGSFRAAASRIDSLSTLVLVVMASLVVGYTLYKFVDSRVRSFITS